MPANQSTTNCACKKNQNFFNNLRRIFSLWRGKIIRGFALRSWTLISIFRNKSAQNASSTFGSFKQQSIFLQYICTRQHFGRTHLSILREVLFFP